MQHAGIISDGPHSNEAALEKVFTSTNLAETNKVAANVNRWVQRPCAFALPVSQCLYSTMHRHEFFATLILAATKAYQSGASAQQHQVTVASALDIVCEAIVSKLPAEVGAPRLS